MYFEYFKITCSLYWIQVATCMDLGYSSDGEIAQFINSKGYLPDDKDLPKPSLIKTKSEKDTTYLLSKLTDDELLKLLNEYSKKTQYDKDDIIKVSDDFKNKNTGEMKNDPEISVPNAPHSAVFRLENKEVDPYAADQEADPKYKALKKLENMLYRHPLIDLNEDSYEKKEILFDILVAQLKAVCCYNNKLKKRNRAAAKIEGQIKKQTEYIFLVVNEEIKSSTTEELVAVDPDSLSPGSTVLLLGPINSPLSYNQTALVINRIVKELTKPEYLPLLGDIANGKVQFENAEIMKSLITGPKTRRYIKPHRCNHQSKLAKIYYGPKWVICTGYLNINTPSLYD